jgi:hypothetical protein
MNRLVLIALFALETSEAFGFAPQLRTCRPAGVTTSTTLTMGMSRKARRQMQQEQKTKVGRDKKFRDALDDDDNNKNDDSEDETQRNDVEEEINRRMDNRPAVSNLYVDEETGMEIIQQGRYVMDVITRKAIVLHPNPDMRLAQMFPGIPMDVRSQHRYDWATVQVPDMIQRLQDACSLKNGELPPAPSVTNTGIDFVLANRDSVWDIACPKPWES